MTKAEREHKQRLVDLGCLACLRIHGPHEPGPVELHHLRADGWGKGDYRTLIPLCYPHHRGAVGIHTLGTKAWEREYWPQRELLAQALEMIEEKQ